jgi:long-subunit acyl-CoA synthetase (AMP-forming)
VIAYRQKRLGVWHEVPTADVEKRLGEIRSELLPADPSSRPEQVLAQLASGGALPAPGGEEVLSYLPLDHPAEQALVVHGGHTVHFGDGRQSLTADLREVQPTLFFAPPGVWEEFHRETESRMNGASPLKRVAYGRRLLVRRPLRRQLGLGRMRTALTDGAVADDTRAWLTSIGIDVKALAS